MIETNKHPEDGLTSRARVIGIVEAAARGQYGFLNLNRYLKPDETPTSWSHPIWESLQDGPPLRQYPVLWASINTPPARHLGLTSIGSRGNYDVSLVLKNGGLSSLRVKKDHLFETADIYTPETELFASERLTDNGMNPDTRRSIVVIESPLSTRIGHITLPQQLKWEALIDPETREFGLAPQEKDFFRRQQVSLGLLEAGTDPLVDSGVGVVKSDSLQKELLTEVSRGKISVSIDLARSVKAVLDAIQPGDYKALESLIANTAVGPQRLKLELLLAEGNVTASLAVQHFDGKKARWRNDKTQDMNPEFVAAIMDQLTEKVPDPEPIPDDQPTSSYWISVNDYSGYPGDGAGRELDWSVQRKPEYEQPTTTSAIMAQKMETRAKGGQRFTSAVARKQARNGQKKKTGKSKKS